MFRRVRKLVWPHHERLLALVMLPAFFLATLPHTACICGDGHREAHCNVAACRAINEGNTTGVCCGCACCQTKSGKPCCCCKAKAKQCRQESDKLPAPGLAAKTGNCCQPIIEAPAPAKGVEKVSISSQLSVVGVLPLPTISEAQPFRLNRLTLDYHGPPPRDAVIVFQHLTI